MLEAAKSVWAADLGATLILFGKSFSLAAFLEVELYTVHSYLEVALLRDDVDKHGMRYTLGFDRVWGDDFFSQVEYHHNDFAASGTKEYKKIKETYFYKNGHMLYLGKDYLTLSQLVLLRTVISWNILCTLNLSEYSAMLSNVLEYRIADNLSSSVSAIKSILSDNSGSSEFSGQDVFFWVGVKYYW